MHTRILTLAFIGFAAATGAANAQSAGDSSVAIGANVSIANVVSALQEAGYQALLSKPAQAPNAILGVIASGIGGAKVSIIAGKCDNAKNDDVCTLYFVSTFNDDKHLIDEKTLEILNKKILFAKATRVARPDGNTILNLSYNYICKDAQDTKFVVPTMQAFGSDLAKFGTAYASGFATQ